MPPKTDSKNTTVERPYGLSEGEMVFAIHACKLLIQEGKVSMSYWDFLTRLHQFHAPF